MAHSEVNDAKLVLRWAASRGDHLMAGIARKIELYNLVYRLAWVHISEHQRREQPDIARRLHDSIRRQVKEGATEPVFIASEALRDIERS